MPLVTVRWDIPVMSALLLGSTVTAVKVGSVKSNALIVLQMEGQERTCVLGVENVNVVMDMATNDLGKNAW